MELRVNGAVVAGLHQQNTGNNDHYLMEQMSDYINLHRGDYIQTYDEGHGRLWSHLYIERM